jgi:4-hydroxybenzoate polyprenyltransferase/phosphoserine phosphatase
MVVAIKTVDRQMDAVVDRGPPPPVFDRQPPLVLDVDQTLVRSDLLLENMLAYLRGNPLRAFQLLGWLVQGRAVLKRRLAERVELDVMLLPINDDLADYAAHEKERGRRVYLATAMDELHAHVVAARFAFVDGVVGSDGVTNLKGHAKAEFLAARFPDGFDYAGDSRADLPVWEVARRALVVNAPSWIENRLRRQGKPVLVFPRSNRLRALLHTARPHQWAKNLLVFVPALLSAQITDPAAVVACVVAFFALSMVASGTYLLNDLLDLPDDRAHWSKRNRPLASGRLPIVTALTAAALFVAGGLAAGAWIGSSALLVLLVYLATTLAYSFKLKRVPILDGFTLASLFTLRIALGIAATQVWASPWLLVFSMLLFGSLSYAKRYTEVTRAQARGAAPNAGRGYIGDDAPLLLGLGLATGVGSILMMVLFLIHDAFDRPYGNPQWLWTFPAALFLWNARIWLVAQRGELNDDPVVFAIKDRLSWVLAGMMMVAFAFAWTGLRLS